VGWLLALGGLATIVVGVLAAPGPAQVVLILAAFAVLGLAFSAACGYQIVARSTRARGRYRGPSPLLVFAVVWFATNVVAGVPVSLGLLDPSASFGFLVGILLVALGYLVGVWLFAVRSGALSWRDMGWPTQREGRLRRALRDVGIAAGVMLPVTVAVVVVGGLLAMLLDVEAPTVVPTPATSLEALAVAVAAAILAPVGEEIFFRGFSLTAWLADLGAGAALVRSALFFAIVHVLVAIPAEDFGTGARQAILQLFVIGTLGLVLGVLFLRRGLVAAIAGHALYNGFLLVLMALPALRSSSI
jgi:hypothetical protein